MDKQQALAKVKKCLALAASPNAHEAAAAMRQAQKLMAEFGFNDADVSLADVAESRTPAQTVDLVNWEALLSKAVALAFGCEVYTSQSVKLGNNWRRVRGREYVFIGVGAAAEVASYAYSVLSRQCAKDRRAHIAKQPKACKPKTKTARGDAFAEGWVLGVRAKLEAFAGNPHDLLLVEQYMARKEGMQDAQPKNRTEGRNVRHNDWHDGRQAGAAARLDRGIGGREAQGLLA